MKLQILNPKDYETGKLTEPDPDGYVYGLFYHNRQTHIKRYQPYGSQPYLAVCGYETSVWAATKSLEKICLKCVENLPEFAWR